MLYGMHAAKSHYVYFCICLTGVELQMRESEERQNTQDPAKVRPTMRSQKVKIAESDKRSIGYGTMNTVLDLDSEVIFSRVFPILY